MLWSLSCSLSLSSQVVLCIWAWCSGRFSGAVCRIKWAGSSVCWCVCPWTASSPSCPRSCRATAHSSSAGCSRDLGECLLVQLPWEVAIAQTNGFTGNYRQSLVWSILMFLILTNTKILNLDPPNRVFFFFSAHIWVTFTSVRYCREHQSD